MSAAPEAAAAVTPARPRRWRPWGIAALILFLALGGFYWATRVERDSRLVGDWYLPHGALFRFHADGRFQYFLHTNGGLTPWYMQHWRTRGNQIEVTSGPNEWKRRWDRLLGLFQRPNVQVTGFSGTNYRIVELGESTMTLQRIPKQASMRVPPAEKFSRTPPVLPPVPSPPNAETPASGR